MKILWCLLIVYCAGENIKYETFDLAMFAVRKRGPFLAATSHQQKGKSSPTHKNATAATAGGCCSQHLIQTHEGFQGFYTVKCLHSLGDTFCLAACQRTWMNVSDISVDCCCLDSYTALVGFNFRRHFCENFSAEAGQPTRGITQSFDL